MINFELDFGGATFTGDAVFYNTTFSQDASFGGATFSQDASFGGATFTGDAHFMRATFSGEADFVRSTFSGNAAFSGTAFTRNAVFIGSTFTRYAVFSGTKFGAMLCLVSAEFAEPPYFEGAEIKTIIWHEANIGTKTATEILNAIKVENKRKQKQGILIASWQVLIGIAEKKHDFKRRQEFHNKLLEVEHYVHGEKIKIPTTHKIYQELGEGADFAKPLWIFFTLCFGFWLFNFVLLFSQDVIYGEFINPAFEALDLVINDAIPLYTIPQQTLYELGNKISQATTGNVWLKLCYVGARFCFIISSTLCLFMAALALRNKFRIK